MITHPFSPYRGQRYTIIDTSRSWGEDRIICCDEDGNSRSVLATWTDYPTADLYSTLEAPVDFRFEDLQMLARLIADVKEL
jgi:hypothetical protein